MILCQKIKEFGEEDEVMVKNTAFGRFLLLTLGVFIIVAGGCATHALQATDTITPEISRAPLIEQKAVDILKVSSTRLGAARTMEFTAVVSYENPSVPGPPLVYTTKSEVALKRPDKLRVITPGDGPASEFYYDGKTMTAFSPSENLAAIDKAPPTIDEALEKAYRIAAIYFPFSDIIVSDPYKHIEEGLTLAFYIGRSDVVGGTTTDMVAYETHGAFVQIWIGIKDKLPRMARAVYRNDPAQLRNQVEFSNWRIDGKIPAKAFSSSQAMKALRIPFDRPDAIAMPEIKSQVESRYPENQ